MSINMVNFEEQATRAVTRFWESRNSKADQGGRAAVVGGKNMDGFIDIIRAVVLANGLHEVDIFTDINHLTLPGYYRPTKRWDLLIVHKKILVAAIELKSHVGSIGNNINNRCEEAIGSATDIWTAYREGAFDDSPRPFIGYLILVEDSEEVRRVSSRDASLVSLHFNMLKE